MGDRAHPRRQGDMREPEEQDETPFREAGVQRSCE
jgi:hypothetical protein